MREAHWPLVLLFETFILMISLFSTYAIRENTYAVDDENINLKHPIPVAPTGTVIVPLVVNVLLTSAVPRANR